MHTHPAAPHGPIRSVISPSGPSNAADRPARPGRLRAWIGGIAAGLSACVALTAQAAGATPFVPASGDTVVATVATSSDTAARRQRQQLAAAPNTLPLALATARAAIERGRRTGDPRELGLAQSALAPWWGQAEPPAAARLMRAIVRQGQHLFDPALEDLQALLDDPRTPLEVRAQAALTRLSVLQVVGRLADAKAACQALTAPDLRALGDALALQAQACDAELASLRGQREAAAQRLATLAQRHPDSAWIALLQAELAQRRGEQRAAEAAFGRALALAPDLYTRAALADALLARGRPDEVLALLQGPDVAADETQADALQLRRAIAWRHLADAGRPGAAQKADTLSRQLSVQLQAARLRGSVPHAREEALLALDVKRQPATALTLAQENWQRQREPVDALLLWRSAVAVAQADDAGSTPSQDLAAHPAVRQARQALQDWAGAGVEPAAIDVRLTLPGAMAILTPTPTPATTVRARAATKERA